MKTRHETDCIRIYNMIDSTIACVNIILKNINQMHGTSKEAQEIVETAFDKTCACKEALVDAKNAIFDIEDMQLPF